jgi:formylmethanofuran--tetrahydromethanopterin N-formyltransferase
MMGEFIIQKSFGIGKGVAGGNLIILAKDVDTALKAGEAAVEAISEVEGVIAPFPGGLCGSGSKVGSKKYRFMHATTNEKYCPTIADLVEGSQTQGAGGVIEVVLDGMSEDAVKEAMRAGIEAAAGVDGVIKITSGNYEGELGNVLINLGDLFEKD